MPNKPKSPCGYPGCPELTADRYCPTHEKEMAARYNRYGRSPEEKKRYGRRWRQIRAQYISEHPLCQYCIDNGKLTAATDVHHIVPLSSGGTHRPDNLMSLCHSCHSRVTANESSFEPRG